MEGSDVTFPSNQRTATANELKDYLNLAKIEINSGISAEERGVVADVTFLEEKENDAITPIPSPKWKHKNPQLSRHSPFDVNSIVADLRPLQDNDSRDTTLTEIINAVMVDSSPSVKWEDIAGLKKAKQCLREMVILPIKRRDLFVGLRKPSRGLLLYGPPGNGKAMLAKAAASESEATFFNVSAYSLTSSWVGEEEKLVRSLFKVAVSRQPSVVFIDEIDGIFSERSANENDGVRRLKSAFLVHFDRAISNPNDLVIVIGATNKPRELDAAVLRRLVRRAYIPLPDVNERRAFFEHKLNVNDFYLLGGNLKTLVEETVGYCRGDLQALCEEAALMPITELGTKALTVSADQLRPPTYWDIMRAMSIVRPSLRRERWEDLDLEDWSAEFGSF